MYILEILGNSCQHIHNESKSLATNQKNLKSQERSSNKTHASKNCYNSDYKAGEMED